MRRIMCSNPECKGVFAHQISQRSIEYGRQDQRLLVTGLDWVAIGTCGEYKCQEKTSITCKDGKIDESELRYEAVTPPVEDPAPVVP